MSAPFRSSSVENASQRLPRGHVPLEIARSAVSGARTVPPLLRLLNRLAIAGKLRLPLAKRGVQFLLFGAQITHQLAQPPLLNDTAKLISVVGRDTDFVHGDVVNFPIVTFLAEAKTERNRIASLLHHLGVDLRVCRRIDPLTAEHDVLSRVVLDLVQVYAFDEGGEPTYELLTLLLRQLTPMVPEGGTRHVGEVKPVRDQRAQLLPFLAERQAGIFEGRDGLTDQLAGLGLWIVRPPSFSFDSARRRNREDNFTTDSGRRQNREENESSGQTGESRSECRWRGWRFVSLCG